MHYYQKNIADYRKDTSHLSLLEHGIYNQLMDSYYLDEKPIKTQMVIRRLAIKTQEEQNALQNVLDDFFECSECGEFWIHSRIDEEISKYQARAETAKANGSKGGRPKKPKKTQPVNLANPEKTKGKANQEPITNNHKPLNNNKPSLPSESKYTFEETHAKITLKLSDPIKKYFPSQKINLEEWADTVRKLINIDKKTEQEILTLWYWVRNHQGSNGFSWNNQIRTPMKLRQSDGQGLKYFDKIQAQMSERPTQAGLATSNRTRDSHIPQNLVDISWAG